MNEERVRQAAKEIKACDPLNVLEAMSHYLVYAGGTRVSIILPTETEESKGWPHEPPPGPEFDELLFIWTTGGIGDSSEIEAWIEDTLSGDQWAQITEWEEEGSGDMWIHFIFKITIKKGESNALG